MRLLISTILAVFGASVLFGSFENLSLVVYPIIWWGLILIADEINLWRWKKSLLISDFKKFLLVIIPLSTLFWVYYEFVNLITPQWVYEGIVPGVANRLLLSFLSFGTVIPIIAEIVWFFTGPFSAFPVSGAGKNFVLKYRVIFILFGAFCMVPIFFTGSVWLNNFMWAGPFFILLPFVITSADSKKASFWLSLVVSGLVSGFLWEFLNFWAGGKWRYIIWPDMPRLFEMPVFGYLGFIPFAFSTIAVYLFAGKFLRSDLATGLVLYVITTIATYLLITSYSAV